MPQLPAPFDLLPPLVNGLRVTVQLTVGGAVVATVAALGAGLARLSPRPLLRAPAVVYIETFRGTSALVQLFWVYFALPFIGIELDALTAGIVVLGLNIGSYGAEVVRGAVQAVPNGQLEAAIALGFTPRQRLWRIVLPQAVVAILPPAGNLFIELLKGTALVSMITLSELTFQAQVLRSSTLRTVEIFTLVLVMYFLVAQCISFGMRTLERRFAHERE